MMEAKEEEMTLRSALENIKEHKKFRDFSLFIMEKMGIVMEDIIENESEMRREAFLTFRKRTKNAAIASLPTIRRWFGIGGISVPDREQIYQMCFAMGLSAKETQEYLFYGIYEPSFQVNDYQETILVYGLENHKTYEECQEMMEELEKQMDQKLEFIQTCGTQMLLSEFHGHKHLPWHQFMEWMLEKAPYFKGYSKTTLKYFMKYKKSILGYIKQDAKDELGRLLAETDYENWCKKHPFLPKESRKKIRKYMYAHSGSGHNMLSQDLCESIKELLPIAYSRLDTNTHLLAEIFCSNRNEPSEKENMGFRTVTKMTGKHLSDLLNIATQKERFFHIQQAWHSLEEVNGEEECPEWIQKMGQEYSRKKHKFENVEQARAWLKEYRSEHKRRCIQIKRSDLLPMVLYVAQRRYLEEIDHDMAKYQRVDALKEFEDLANSTLTACNMCELSEEYQLDVVLRACYQKGEMYSYSELLEMV